MLDKVRFWLWPLGFALTLVLIGSAVLSYWQGNVQQAQHTLLIVIAFGIFDVGLLLWKRTWAPE